MIALGIDVGGTAVKGAPVDVGTGRLVARPLRISTPRPPTPGAVAEVMVQIVRSFPVAGAVGCGLPALVPDDVVQHAANLDATWHGLDAAAFLGARLGRDVQITNDADAAGLAEARFGAGRGLDGLVLVVTLGTGIGTALLVGGKLLPNTELGQIELDGRHAEDVASERARVENHLSWEAFATSIDRYLAAVELLVRPDLIVLGGGGSERSDQFLPLLSRRCPVVPAQLGGDAGIVGAALAVALSNAAAPPTAVQMVHEATSTSPAART